MTDRYDFSDVFQWSTYVERWADRENVDENLIYAVMDFESNGNPNSISVAGACGLMQVMPGHFATGEKCRDPDTNVRTGVRYLADRLRACGSLTGGVIGYFSGGCQNSGRADQYGTTTGRYAEEVLDRYEELEDGGTACRESCYAKHGRPDPSDLESRQPLDSDLTECLRTCNTRGGLTGPFDAWEVLKDLLGLGPGKALDIVNTGDLMPLLIQMLPVVGAALLSVMLIGFALLSAAR